MILEFDAKGNVNVPCASVSLWRRVNNELTVFLIGGRSFAFYDNEADDIEAKLRAFYETGQKSRGKPKTNRSGKATSTDREKT